MRSRISRIGGTVAALLILTSCSVVDARRTVHTVPSFSPLHDASTIPEIFAGAITLVAALAATFLSLVGRIRRRVRERKSALPPWTRAHQELDRLIRLHLSSEKRYREFYDGISRLVRSYVEEMFDLSAPEQTTEEFLYSLRRSRHLGGRGRTLSEFLSHCDLLKFAAYLPAQDEVDKAIGSCRAFIDSTSRETPLR